MAMSGPRTEQRHAEPFVRQFSIFLPNRVGRLADLLDVLDDANVTVAGIAVVDSADWAVVRMIFTEPGKAKKALAAAGIAFTECEVLAVVLSDDQTLHQICRTLVGAELNVQFAYSLVIQRDECPVIVFHVDDVVLAREILGKHGFTLLDHEDR